MRNLKEVEDLWMVSQGRRIDIAKAWNIEKNNSCYVKCHGISCMGTMAGGVGYARLGGLNVILEITQ